MIIREANNNDISKIVKIHLNRFSSFFLTSLGAFFLKIFYKDSGYEIYEIYQAYQNRKMIRFIKYNK